MWERSATVAAQTGPSMRWEKRAWEVQRRHSGEFAWRLPSTLVLPFARVLRRRAPDPAAAQAEGAPLSAPAPGYLQTWPRSANMTTRAERAGPTSVRAVAPSFDFHPSPHRPAHAQVRSGQHPRRGTRPETATYADHLCVLTIRHTAPSANKSVRRRREDAEVASLGLNLPRPSRLEHELTPLRASSPRGDVPDSTLLRRLWGSHAFFDLGAFYRPTRDLLRLIYIGTCEL